MAQQHRNSLGRGEQRTHSLVLRRYMEQTIASVCDLFSLRVHVPGTCGKRRAVGAFRWSIFLANRGTSRSVWLSLLVWGVCGRLRAVAANKVNLHKPGCVILLKRQPLSSIMYKERRSSSLDFERRAFVKSIECSSAARSTAMRPSYSLELISHA